MNDFYTPEKKKRRYLVQVEVSLEVELEGDVDADAAIECALNLVNKSLADGIGNGYTAEVDWQPMVMTENGWKEVEDK